MSKLKEALLDIEEFWPEPDPKLVGNETDWKPEKANLKLSQCVYWQFAASAYFVGAFSKIIIENQYTSIIRTKSMRNMAIAKSTKIYTVHCEKCITHTVVKYCLTFG